MTTRRIPVLIGLCMLSLAGCRRPFGATDEGSALGSYVLQPGKDPSGLSVSATITLNADHTFSEVESIRITATRTSDWSSSGTWSLHGRRLVKVHKTAAGPVTELALIDRDTLRAGWSVLTRK